MVTLVHYTCQRMREWMNDLDIFSVRDFIKRLLVYLYAVKSHALSRVYQLIANLLFRRIASPQ